MFSEKATKIYKIFTVDLKLCSKCQIDVEDFANFCGLLRKHELYLSQYFMEVKIVLTLGEINFYIQHNLREIRPGDLVIELPYWQTPCTHFPLSNIPVVQESPNIGQLVLSVASIIFGKNSNQQLGN